MGVAVQRNVHVAVIHADRTQGSASVHQGLRDLTVAHVSYSRHII